MYAAPIKIHRHRRQEKVVTGGFVPTGRRASCVLCFWHPIEKCSNPAGEKARKPPLGLGRLSFLSVVASVPNVQSLRSGAPNGRCSRARPSAPVGSRRYGTLKSSHSNRWRLLGSEDSYSVKRRTTGDIRAHLTRHPPRSPPLQDVGTCLRANPVAYVDRQKPTRRSPWRFFGRTPGPPWNRTFAKPVEEIRVLRQRSFTGVD